MAYLRSRNGRGWGRGGGNRGAKLSYSLVCCATMIVQQVIHETLLSQSQRGQRLNDPPPLNAHFQHNFGNSRFLLRFVKSTFDGATVVVVVVVVVVAVVVVVVPIEETENQSVYVHTNLKQLFCYSRYIQFNGYTSLNVALFGILSSKLRGSYLAVPILNLATIGSTRLSIRLQSGRR